MAGLMMRALLFCSFVPPGGFAFAGRPATLRTLWSGRRSTIVRPSSRSEERKRQPFFLLGAFFACVFFWSRQTYLYLLESRPIHALAPTATMPKTGWKYTKQAPAKGSTNMLKRSNASSKQGRRAPKGHGNDSNMRSADTIARLKMYNNGKAIRNKEGTVVGGQFMMGDRAGDTKITSCEYDRSEPRHIARPFLFVIRMPSQRTSFPITHLDNALLHSLTPSSDRTNRPR